MNISLQKSKLSKALIYTSRVVSSKLNIPILSNVLLKIQKNILTLSATNLEMGIVLWIPSEVVSEGSLTVNAKYISDFVSATSEESIDLILSGNNLISKTESSEAKFSIISAEEFPILPKVSGEPIFIIKKDILKEALTKVIFACSTDLSSGRIQQSGVLFDINREESKVDFIGLDGFRLSRKTSEVTSLKSEITREEIIVPAKYLGELLKILGDFEDVNEVEVYLSENNSQLIFKFAEIEFSTRLLEGPYPEYKKIMPEETSFSFTFKKSDFENSLKIVNSFARGNLGNKTLFDFEIENSSVTLKSSVSEIGEGRTVIKIEVIEGESDLNTAYTLKYLQDFINHVKGDDIVYETKGPLAPAVLKDSKDENFIHLIMPMRRDF